MEKESGGGSACLNFQIVKNCCPGVLCTPGYASLAKRGGVLNETFHLKTRPEAGSNAIVKMAAVALNILPRLFVCNQIICIFCT